MAKRKYYPNNWQAYKDMPDDCYESITYEQFEDWKIDGYLIPDSVSCIMRIQSPKTGKIKEVYYSKTRWAQKRVKRCMKENETFTLVSMDGTFHLSPSDTYDYDNIK